MPGRPSDAGGDEIDLVLQAVRQEGGRLTAPRRIVLEALNRRGEAGATAEQLADDIRRDHPSFSDSTVYRSLERFEQLGIATHAHLGHSAAVWRLADRPRFYVVCSGCDAVVSLGADRVEPLLTELMRQVGFRFDGHFALTGLCRACSPEQR